MAWLAVSIIVLWGVIKPTLYKGIMPYVDDYLNFLRWQTSVDVRQKRPPAAAPAATGGQTFDKKTEPKQSQATRAKQMSQMGASKPMSQAPAPTPPPQSLGASQANGNAGKKRSSGKKPDGEPAPAAIGAPAPARASSGSLL